jgi:hypothetical protein
MARDLMMVKEALKLLGNKVDAIAKATGTTDEQLSAIMIANNVAELKTKVDNLVAQGVLVASDIVTSSSFLVGKEQDDDGKIVNPRLQFAISALGEELKAKMVGAKVGDVLTLTEGKLKFEVSEIYQVQTVEKTEEAPSESGAELDSSEQTTQEA